MAPPAAPAAPAPASAGARYPQLLRVEGHRWWRPVLGLMLATVTVIAASTGVLLAVAAWLAVVGDPADPFDGESLDLDRPLGLLAGNLAIATLIPAAALAVWAVHPVPIGVLASVTARLRTGLLRRLLLLAGLAALVFVAAGLLLPGGGVEDADAPSGTTLVPLLAVVALTTPLQAAAEEVGFRGYLSQAVASWFARPAAGALLAAGVSATLFALSHGAQDAALFTDRFAFGAVMSWLVWRTGGLEAAIALHVANNVVTVGVSAATGTLRDALEASTLSWPLAVLDVAMMVAYAAVAARLAARWRVDVRRPAPTLALAAPSDVGYPGSRSSTPPPAGDRPPWGMG